MEVNGIDSIIGGHLHRLIYTGKFYCFWKMFTFPYKSSILTTPVIHVGTTNFKTCHVWFQANFSSNLPDDNKLEWPYPTFPRVWRCPLVRRYQSYWRRCTPTMSKKCNCNCRVVDPVGFIDNTKVRCGVGLQRSSSSWFQTNLTIYLIESLTSRRCYLVLSSQDNIYTRDTFISLTLPSLPSTRYIH